jgi:hypothetical protein
MSTDVGTLGTAGESGQVQFVADPLKTAAPPPPACSAGEIVPAGSLAGQRVPAVDASTEPSLGTPSLANDFEQPPASQTDPGLFPDRVEGGHLCLQELR